MGFRDKARRESRDSSDSSPADKLMGSHRKVEEVIGEEGGGYWDLIENSPYIIQSVTPDGRYFYVNRTWRDTLGYSTEDARELTFLDILHPDCHEHCMAVFGKLVSGSKFESVDCTFVTRDGRRLEASGNVSCHFESGRPFATRGIFRLVEPGMEESDAREKELDAEREAEMEVEELYLEFHDLVSHHPLSE